ncbi:MAG: DUF6010 family protein [Gemmatimonadetes bacterium]|nr:DUF6010 family protein [Gemmatimonadota bacterium]
MIGALTGVAVAIALVVVVRLLPLAQRTRLFAILLGAAAAMYAGAELTTGSIGTTGLAVAAAFLLLALFSVDRPGLLAFAWIGHAVWDALHYVGTLRTGLPADYQVACFAADLVWAAWLFTLVPRRPVMQQEGPGVRT